MSVRPHAAHGRRALVRSYEFERLFRPSRRDESARAAADDARAAPTIHILTHQRIRLPSRDARDTETFPSKHPSRVHRRERTPHREERQNTAQDFSQQCSSERSRQFTRRHDARARERQPSAREDDVEKYTLALVLKIDAVERSHVASSCEDFTSSGKRTVILVPIVVERDVATSTRARRRARSKREKSAHRTRRASSRARRRWGRGTRDRSAVSGATHR